ncbi:MAG: choice-of-anchor D domain-containing protein [Burkholderiales bacterium]|nr:choice-of-anchor D domain-containing protein [Burkholderiales bacterium]
MIAIFNPLRAARRAWQPIVLLPLLALLVAGHAPAQPALDVSTTYLGFGRVSLNTTSPIQPLFVMNVGDAAMMLHAITLGGDYPELFAVGGTCAETQQLAPRARCRIDVAFRPTVAGQRNATLSIVTDAASAPLVVALSGLGNGSIGMTATPNPNPDWIDFGSVALGASAAPRALTFRNDSGIALRLTSLGLQTRDRYDFTLSSTCNVGDALPNGSTCTFTFGFAPTEAGVRATTLYVGISYMEITEGVVYIQVSGVGGVLAPSPYVEAVEYYHGPFDHYFVTAIGEEIDRLDVGDFAGWARTGRSINVYPAAAPGLVAVCRFFSTAFGERSSHFYTALASECAKVKDNPSWMFEGDVFLVGLPVEGNCGGASIPVYRLYNEGMGGAPNHRFTTDLQVQGQMRSLGWTAEGDGVGVVMCALR